MRVILDVKPDCRLLVLYSGLYYAVLETKTTQLVDCTVEVSFSQSSGTEVKGQLCSLHLPVATCAYNMYVYNWVHMSL